MPLFCDVALAVPLDMVFTYAIPPGMEPVVGGRVLVPFRQQRLSGIVVELHDRPPRVKTQQIKKVIEALDLSPVLDEQLLKLGKWIADYYLAPIGEVFRAMLPLGAEVQQRNEYSITDTGREALAAALLGSPGSCLLTQTLASSTTSNCRPGAMLSGLPIAIDLCPHFLIPSKLLLPDPPTGSPKPGCEERR